MDGEDSIWKKFVTNPHPLSRNCKIRGAKMEKCLSELPFKCAKFVELLQKYKNELDESKVDELKKIFTNKILKKESGYLFLGWEALTLRKLEAMDSLEKSINVFADLIFAAPETYLNLHYKDRRNESLLFDVDPADSHKVVKWSVKNDWKLTDALRGNG